MTTVYAHLKMQRLLDESGFKYFLAVPNISWLTPIFGILAHETENGFDYWEARKKKLELDHIWKSTPKRLYAELMKILANNPYCITA